MHGKAMPYAIVTNNTSGTHGNLKGSKLVNLSVIPETSNIFLPTQKIDSLLLDNQIGCSFMKEQK